MESRLHTIDPELANLIGQASIERTRAIASQVSAWATARIAPNSAFPTETAELSSLVASLDDQYFQLQEMLEQGQGTEQRVMEAFTLARAANAALYGAQGNALDAVYEAVIATDDLREAHALVHSLLA